MDVSLWVLGGAVVLIGIYLIVVYNQLVALKLRGENAFAQIDVQLKRRYDLIPNLVSVAKSYIKHERETLEAVVQARNNAVQTLEGLDKNITNGEGFAAVNAAEASLGQAMGQLRVTMEAYPDLKASENMQQLSEELSSTENKVSFSRQAFNDAVNAYNAYRQSFPPVAVSAMLGHGADMTFLEFEEDAQTLNTAPKVDFG